MPIGLVVPKIIWSKPARTDLYRIAHHLAQDRPEFAKTYCLELIAKVEAVAQFPQRGQQVPRQPSPSLRELVLPPYRVIYELSDDRTKPGILSRVGCTPW